MADPKKVHKLQIRNKQEADGKISVGANMEVLLDGAPLKGVSFFKFEVKARGVSKILLEMYADVEIDANVEFTSKNMEPTDLTLKEGQSIKAVSLYQIGNYEPKGIATKLEPINNCGTCSCRKKDGHDKHK